MGNFDSFVQTLVETPQYVESVSWLWLLLIFVAGMIIATMVYVSTKSEKKRGYVFGITTVLIVTFSLWNSTFVQNYSLDREAYSTAELKAVDRILTEGQWYQTQFLAKKDGTHEKDYEITCTGGETKSFTSGKTYYSSSYYRCLNVEKYVCLPKTWGREVDNPTF